MKCIRIPIFIVEEIQNGDASTAEIIAIDGK